MKKTEILGGKVILASVLLAAATSSRASLVSIAPNQVVSYGPSAAVNGTTMGAIEATDGLLTQSGGAEQLFVYETLRSTYVDMAEQYNPHTHQFNPIVEASGTLVTTVYKVGSDSGTAPLLFDYTISNTDAQGGSGGPNELDLEFYQSAIDMVGFGTNAVGASLFSPGGSATDATDTQSMDFMFNGDLARGQSASMFIYTSDPYTELGGATLLGGGSGYTQIYAALPEPSTVVSGALLMLPMGASAIRILRKKALSAKA